jgi:sodium-dependent dicarboxylate transporter 2/3/5
MASADRHTTPPGTTGRRGGQAGDLTKLLAGPLAGVALALLLLPSSLAPAGCLTAGAAVWMAVWWVLEPVPIPVTALLPILLFPVLGVAEVADVATSYGNPIIFLLLGGTLLGLAVQKCHLHRRIALATVLLFGTGPRQIVFGLMVSSGFISAWVSNTATAVIMVPIALSVVRLVGEAAGRTDTRFAASALLGVAYAITIGGFGTLIGQPVNPLLVAYLERNFGIEISFGQWMLFAVPISVLFLGVAWFVLTVVVFPSDTAPVAGGGDLFRREYRSLGPMTVDEKRVAGVFVLAVLGWVALPPISEMPTVATAAPFLAAVDDTVVALLAGVLMFVLPGRASPEEQERGLPRRLLSWSDAGEVPWGVLLLIGGGLALSAQLTASGLSDWLGARLGTLAQLPPLALYMLVALVLVVLTEFTSNTATAAAFFPVMGALAIGIGQDPLLMSLAVALAVTCAFMLPVATPSNAVAYATGEVTIRTMMRVGIWMNVVGLGLVGLALVTVAPLVFGVGL